MFLTQEQTMTASFRAALAVVFLNLISSSGFVQHSNRLLKRQNRPFLLNVAASAKKGFGKEVRCAAMFFGVFPFLYDSFSSPMFIA